MWWLTGWRKSETTDTGDWQRRSNAKERKIRLETWEEVCMLHDPSHCPSFRRPSSTASVLCLHSLHRGLPLEDYPVEWSREASVNTPALCLSLFTVTPGQVSQRGKTGTVDAVSIPRAIAHSHCHFLPHRILTSDINKHRLFLPLTTVQ